MMKGQVVDCDMTTITQMWNLNEEEKKEQGVVFLVESTTENQIEEATTLLQPRLDCIQEEEEGEMETSDDETLHVLDDDDMDESPQVFKGYINDHHPSSPYASPTPSFDCSPDEDSTCGDLTASPTSSESVSVASPPDSPSNDSEDHLSNEVEVDHRTNFLKVTSSGITIQMGSASIFDDGAAAIAQALAVHKTVTEIDLSDNEITAAGAQALAAALKTNTSVTTIDLSDNNIGYEGAMHMAEALKENKSIVALNLRGNHIGEKGAAALAEALQVNMSVVCLRIDEGLESNDRILACCETNMTVARHIDALGEAETAKFSFYANLDNVAWTEDAWDAVRGDGRALCLLRSVLASFLAEDEGYGMEESERGQATQDKKKIISEMVANDRDPEDETKGLTLLHRAVCLESVHAFELVKLLVENVGVNIDNIVDNDRRSIRDVGITSDNIVTSKWMRTVGTVFGRYAIKGGRGFSSIPEYKSKTSTVFFATDMAKAKSDPQYYVALKVMDDEDQFKKEINAHLVVDPRNGEDVLGVGAHRFDTSHVTPLLRYHDGPDPTSTTEKHLRVLVLLQGTRNLQEIMLSEGVAAKDVDKVRKYGSDLAKAIRHLHGEGFVHCNIKPRNVVRGSDTDLKLVDLSATVKPGDVLSNTFSSAYMTPEMARFKFRPADELDTLRRLLAEKKRTRAALEEEDQEGDMTLSKEIALLYARIKAVRAIVDDALQADLTKASKSMDIWAFGATMYYMLTGKPLFECSEDQVDRLASEEEQLKLMNWNGFVDDKGLAGVLRGCKTLGENEKERARYFLQKCLHKNPEERFRSMDDVLEDPFFSGYAPTGAVDTIERMTKVEREIKNLASLNVGMQKLLVSRKKATIQMLEHVLQGDNIYPKYIYVVPREPEEGWIHGLSHWRRPENWAASHLIAYFVCPLTLECCGEGYQIEDPRKWVEHYGPAMQVSLSVLRVASPLGLMAGFPIPRSAEAMDDAIQGQAIFLSHAYQCVKEGLSDAGLNCLSNFIEENVSQCGEKNSDSKHANGYRWDPAKAQKICNRIKETYGNIMRMPSSDPQEMERQMGLRLVECMEQGTTEYIKASDSRVQELYRKQGTDCLSLTPSALSEGLHIIGVALQDDDAQSSTQADSWQTPEELESIASDDSFSNLAHPLAVLPDPPSSVPWQSDTEDEKVVPPEAVNKTDITPQAFSQNLDALKSPWDHIEEAQTAKQQENSHSTSFPRDNTLHSGLNGIQSSSDLGAVDVVCCLPWGRKKKLFRK